MTQEQACEHLGVHRSTLWRLKKRASKGVEGLAHGLRGKPNNRKADTQTRKAVCQLYEHEYREHGFAPRHFFDQADFEKFVTSVLLDR